MIYFHKNHIFTNFGIFPISLYLSNLKFNAPNIIIYENIIIWLNIHNKVLQVLDIKKIKIGILIIKSDIILNIIISEENIILLENILYIFIANKSLL